MASKKTATGKTVGKASPSKAAKPAAQKTVKNSATPAASKAVAQKPAQKLAQKPAQKPAPKKVAGGLIGRIKGALSKPKVAKPAASKAAVDKSPAKPVAKPVAMAVSKPSAKAAKPAAAASKAVSAASKSASSNAAAGAAAKSGASTSASAPAQPPSPLKKKARVSMEALSALPILTEDQIRAMPEEDYMNAQQLAFFRQRLLQMRDEVLQREVDVKERLHEREVFADPADRASAEEEHWLDLRLRERESLLLHKIDDALRRIESDEFGWCEKTGDPIGIPRLLARPTATVCVDVKGQDERVEAQFRDR